jgi:hypothetical protein
MSSHTSPEQRALRTIYCNLMAEIKHRCVIVGKTLNHEYQVPDWPAYELCYLQLRMICELIALGALAVHGDIPTSRGNKIRDSVKADWIVKTLEKMHPRFYPTPGIPIVHPDGHHEFVPATWDYLTKPKFLKLYWKCGGALHRGSFKRLHKMPDFDFEAIKNHAGQILALLSAHKIALFGSDHELWVSVKPEVEGEVEATLVGPVEGK